MSRQWSPGSWREFSAKQLPVYADKEKLTRVSQQLHDLPPLVHRSEVDKLTSLLAEAAAGKRFVLWGGDCAEEFRDTNARSIETKFRILLQMSLVLIFEGRLPVVRIGRVAGQYGKPRTADTETLADGRVVKSYKGDMVNGLDVDDREPDANRMLEGYFRSAATLNYIRGLCHGGAASLHSTQSWNMDQVLTPELNEKYQAVVQRITDGLEFVDVVAHDSLSPIMNEIELYTSHEGLLLEYEQALTRQTEDGLFYDLSGHLIWIGDRTRAQDSAHVEFFRGTRNPVAVKVGPSTTAEDITYLVKVLNPERIPGRLTLITRFGASQVKEKLPAIVRAVQETGIPVLWVCDPCHGNTKTSAVKLKTRNFGDIMTELVETFATLQSLGVLLGGVHLELTGDNVTECTGGAAELLEHQLTQRFVSACDPRLNNAQSLDIAFRVGEILKNRRRTSRK